MRRRRHRHLRLSRHQQKIRCLRILRAHITSPSSHHRRGLSPPSSAAQPAKNPPASSDSRIVFVLNPPRRIRPLSSAFRLRRRHILHRLLKSQPVCDPAQGSLHIASRTISRAESPGIAPFIHVCRRVAATGSEPAGRARSCAAANPLNIPTPPHHFIRKVVLSLPLARRKALNPRTGKVYAPADPLNIPPTFLPQIFDSSQGHAHRGRAVVLKRRDLTRAEAEQYNVDVRGC